MRKNILNAAVLLLLAFVAGACSDSDTTRKVDNGRRSGAATRMALLDGDENEISTLTLSLGASNYIIGIDCDGDWTASVDADWVTLSNYAGYGFTNKLSYDKISLTKNQGDERTATVTFKSGNITRTLTIIQKGSNTDPGDTFMSGFQLVVFDDCHCFSSFFIFSDFDNRGLSVLGKDVFSSLTNLQSFSSLLLPLSSIHFFLLFFLEFSRQQICFNWIWGFQWTQQTS